MGDVQSSSRNGHSSRREHTVNFANMSQSHLRALLIAVESESR